MFNIEEFDIKLDTDFIGRNFIYCEEVDSTNSVFLNSDEFEEHGSVLLAEFQSEGRGRKKRQWLSIKEQNLTFSILFKKEVPPERMNLINLGASLAVAQSIENLFQLKTNLKWPNDVLVNDKKISGILLESVTAGNNIEKFVVGIGINVNQPNFTGHFIIEPTSIKKEYGEPVSREKLLGDVLNNFEKFYRLTKRDPKKVLDDWKQRSRFLGENIKIENDTSVIFGKFEDIDENGAMLLRTDKGIEVINFGDVSLR